MSLSSAAEAATLAELRGHKVGGCLPPELWRDLSKLPAIESLPDTTTIGELRARLAERYPGATWPAWQGDVRDLTGWLAAQVEKLPTETRDQGRHEPLLVWYVRAHTHVIAATRELLGVLLTPPTPQAEPPKPPKRK